MAVVEAEKLRSLTGLDFRAPRILGEPELEEVGHIAHRCDDFPAGGLQLLHLSVEVGERKTDVIDRAACARLAVRILQEDQPRASEHQSVGRFRRWPAAEVLLIPLDRLCLIGDIEVHVVVGQRRRLRARPESGTEDESKRHRDDGRSHGLSLSVQPERADLRLPYQKFAMLRWCALRPFHERWSSRWSSSRSRRRSSRSAVASAGSASPGARIFWSNPTPPTTSDSPFRPSTP